MEGNSTALCNTTGRFDSFPTFALISVPYKGQCNVTIQCLTLNADCLNNHCECPQLHDFYLNGNDSCQTKPALGINFDLNVINERNDSVEINASLSVQNSSDGVQFYAKLIDDPNNRTDYFKITNGSSTIRFRDLMPAQRYNIVVSLSKNGVPSNESETVAVVTAPNCEHAWNIKSVTETTFRFYQNSTFDSFEFTAIEVPT
ncbi:hypothetical protein DPMN_020472 [Dreissena polymorpha]|uniref:Uncharacterized protein n=2 Tax=Dreissena polymorpha TaxID=45954 RepID=A0A9D4S936_DREPO|nr:hypothetical protein DPMN_020472 [Dreissena polymorpha]